ncbi:MAG: hypothetical protein KDK70_25240 [Myxococcales bacterium]|nr:hypothetical protein [Myxococcales bacterium]
MDWLRMTSLALGVGLAAACQSNTIDLESDTDGDDTSDSPTSGSPTSGSPSSGSPTIGPDSTSDPDAGDVDTSDSDPSDTVDPDPDTGPVPVPDQPFLLAIDSVISPGQPIQGIVWLSGGGNTIDITLQWLSAETRTLIGDVYAYPDVALDPQGGFAWDTGVILLPAEANPFVPIDAVLSAAIQAAPEGEPYCGRVRGEVLDPINSSLEGSTHAITLVPSVDDLPANFLSACP